MIYYKLSKDDFIFWEYLKQSYSILYQIGDVIK